MKKLLIIDGNSIMNRAFYAVPLLSTTDGIHTNGIYGFLNMLYKMKEDFKPDYIVSTFDKKAPTFRHKEYADYKAGRKKMPSEMASQFPILKDILTAMAIDIYEVDGFEADDLIGTISKQAEEKGMEVFIVTGDKDALQLATQNIKIVYTKRGISEVEIYDYDKMIEEYGVTPTEFIDVKGLMGDPSDNIPGVPGIGKLTAFKLIKQYHSIENVLDHIEDFKGKQKENLVNFAEQGIFSKKLATIETDVPIDIDFDSIRSKEEFDVSVLREMFTNLQLKSLLAKLPKPEREKRECNVKEISLDDKIDFSLNDTLYITYNLAGDNLISTLNMDSISIYVNDIIYNIDLLAQDLTKLSYIFESDSKKIVNDAKNLYKVAKKNGMNVKNIIFDTSIAAYIIDSADTDYSIKQLIMNNLDIECEEGLETSYMQEIYNVQIKKLEELGMEDLYYNVELPLTKLLSDMELTGFNIDRSVLDSLGVEFNDMIQRIQAEIYEYSDEEFNINSPKQLGKILFEKLDLPVIKKTKTGYSTNVDVLNKLKDKHPIIEKILEYRHVAKLHSTYIEGLKNVIDVDGRIHSTFKQTVTTTGRLSSTDPNLQNIPIRTEMGRSIRKVFIPLEEGEVLLSADYSQIELRVLAHMSGDPNMINAFRENADIHTITASQVFGIEEQNVTPQMRSAAKAVNFGIVYGISDFALSEDLKISRKEAKEYIEKYFETYSRVQEFLKEIIEIGKENMYVTTILNRRRFIPELKATNKIVQSLGERLAMNAPIQGSAADIIKLAMVNVYNRLIKENCESKLLLQVHDEIILSVKKSELDLVSSLVKEEMENVISFSVPLKVDISIGNTWYEAK